jgi:hypothetical protein
LWGGPEKVSPMFNCPDNARERFLKNIPAKRAYCVGIFRAFGWLGFPFAFPTLVHMVIATLDHTLSSNNAW